MKQTILKNKKFDFGKLKKYGFIKTDKGFIFSKKIMDGTFELTVDIPTHTKIKTVLTEIETDEEYSLHYNKSAVGEFVGKVRAEYENVIDGIIENCSVMDVFEWEYSKKVLKYASETYGTEPEYLWEKFPRNAVCRRADNKKWYFAILSVKQNRLGFEGEDIIEVIDLRVEKSKVEELLKRENIYPAYHMNKKSWVTVILDGSMKIEQLYKMIDESYMLAKKK